MFIYTYSMVYIHQFKIFSSSFIIPITLTLSSMYLFSTSLIEINKIYLLKNNILKKSLIIFNSCVMIISGITSIYTIEKILFNKKLKL